MPFAVSEETGSFKGVNCEAIIVGYFIGTIFGIAQITTLIFISYDRFNVVVRGMQATPLTFGKVFIFLIIVWVWSGLWAAGPFFGFGLYALDGILAS